MSEQELLDMKACLDDYGVQELQFLLMQALGLWGEDALDFTASEDDLFWFMQQKLRQLIRGLEEEDDKKLENTND